MRTLYQTSASALRAASFVAFSVLVTASAWASEGSTDFYAARAVTASFGAPAQLSALPLVTGSVNGSTDTWGVNGFSASFGTGASTAQAVSACGSASTDTYGVNGFRASFGEPASQVAGELAQACQAPASVVR